MKRTVPYLESPEYEISTLKTKLEWSELMAKDWRSTAERFQPAYDREQAAAKAVEQGKLDAELVDSIKRDIRVEAMKLAVNAGALPKDVVSVAQSITEWLFAGNGE